MNWRNDSTETNLSLLSKWADDALRPIVRILRSANVPQDMLRQCVQHCCMQYDGEKPKGHLGSGSRYPTLLALSCITKEWARSPQWTDNTGSARQLSLDENDARSFHALVRSVEPLFDVSLALDELQKMHVVRLTGSPVRARLLRDTVGNMFEESFSVESVLADIEKFARTIEHNLFRNRTTQDAWTQLTAIRLSLDPAHFSDFARFAKRLGHAFIHSADDRLLSYSAAEGGSTYGAGIFVFFDESHSRHADHADSTATNTSLLSQWAHGMLRPLVRILRSAGVSSRSMLDMMMRANQSYESEAPKGRLNSGSSDRAVHALAPIPDAWAHSSEWTDVSGSPRELSLNKGDPKGFIALVRSVAPALDPAQVLAELRHMNVVRLMENTGRARLLQHNVVHAGNDTFFVESVLREFQRFAETIEYNIFRDRRTEDGRTHLTAARLALDPSQFADFARFVKRNGQALLESVDDRLRSYPESRAGASYGMGLFTFFHDPG